jgi:hypothetical protein
MYELVAPHVGGGHRRELDRRLGSAHRRAMVLDDVDADRHASCERDAGGERGDQSPRLSSRSFGDRSG